MGNEHLEELITSKYLTTIGVEVFKNCSKLRSIYFAKGIRDIYAGAFQNCSNLTNINFPDGIRYIYSSAFSGCTNLIELSFPKSIQTLPEDLCEVSGRTIKIYNPQTPIIVNKTAEGIVICLYKDSLSAACLEEQGITTEYFDSSYATISKASKAPAKAVSGSGKADSSWYNKEKKSFEIKNPDQLAGLALLVNNGCDFKGKTVSLIKDLDLSCYSNWIPIGHGYQKDYNLIRFRGTFNGNNHIIYNLRINSSDEYQGLFGAFNGVVKNVNISGADVTGYSCVGILSGRSTYASIINCKVSGKVNGVNAVGGLIGECSNPIKYCSVDAEVTGITNIGGIVGVSGAQLINCSNNGSVSGYENVGGYAGKAYSGEINNCINGMKVTGDINIGGIFGETYYSKLNLNNNRNKAEITGNENVGGIFGRSSGELTVRACINQGNVTGIYYVGGISGKFTEGNISDCRNTANISGVSYVGGILSAFGKSLQTGFVTGCSNTGMVKGKSNVGLEFGIIGKDFPTDL